MDLWSHHFSQNTNEILSGFLPCSSRTEILTIFCSYFGRNDDFINSFWNLLTFSKIAFCFELLLSWEDSKQHSILLASQKIFAHERFYSKILFGFEYRIKKDTNYYNFFHPFDILCAWTCRHFHHKKESDIHCMNAFSKNLIF